MAININLQTLCIPYSSADWQAETKIINLLRKKNLTILFFLTLSMKKLVKNKKAKLAGTGKSFFYLLLGTITFQ